MRENQVRLGAILSYILIALNTVYGLFLTPYIVGCLGEAEYGVYKSMASLTTSLMVLDLGMGGTVMRYIAKFRSTEDDDRIPNFVAMSFVQAMLMCGVIVLVASGLYQSIDNAYKATFSVEQIDKAKSIFRLLIINVVAHVVENIANGVISGYNRFSFGNGIKVIRLSVRIFLIWVLLKWIPDSKIIILVDLSATIVFLIIELLYVRLYLRVAPKLMRWERSLFIESGKYTVLMFLTSIAAQVNNNLDNVFIGALSGPTYVAVYSFGLLIFSMFEQLSTSISGVMLPTVTSYLEKPNGMQEVIKLVIQAGRIQFMLLGAAFVGFLCIGREFVLLWLGIGYQDVYIITLILMGPALFELCVNVCLSILRARNMLVFRTLTLFAATALNAIVTYIAITKWSYIGAAFGTAISFTVGSLLIMNAYYQIKLGLPMLSIYAHILSRTWICLLLSGLALYIYKMVMPLTILALIGGIVLFIVVYAFTMLRYGFSEGEKQMLVRKRYHK